MYNILSKGNQIRFKLSGKKAAYRTWIHIRKISNCSFYSMKQIIINTKRNWKFSPYMLSSKGSNCKEWKPIEFQEIKAIDQWRESKRFDRVPVILSVPTETAACNFPQIYIIFLPVIYSTKYFLTVHYAYIIIDAWFIKGRACRIFILMYEVYF